MKYKITIEDQYKYATILLLEVMIQEAKYFPIVLEGDDMALEPILILMLSKSLIDIVNNQYVPTEKGRELVKTFYSKYVEYINLYDLFCAVDLEKGEFAFSSWFNFEDDDVWNEFLEEERFEDVRVAVCEFKGIDPIEMIFMAFVSADRFDLTVNGWQFDITSGLIWDEILEICNTNISREQLDEQGAMEAIIEGGMVVAKDKRKKNAEIEAEIAEQDEIINNPKYEDVEEEIEEEEEEVVTYVETVEDVVYEDSYFDPYYDDIYYMSPLWIVPLILF